MRRFSSYGPIDPLHHFHVPRTELIAQSVRLLVGEEGGRGHFFTLWAPRQTGKTWIMRRARDEIQERYGDRFTVVILTLQRLMNEGDPDEVFLRGIPGRLEEALGVALPPLRSFEEWRRLFMKSGGLFDRPVILLIDEFDSLTPQVIDTLVALFRQMYLTPDAYHLHGLLLVGVRAVLGLDSDRGSPFNVQRSLHVPHLTEAEVVELFRQYQDESGQVVAPAVVQRVFSVTRGQPGLLGWFGELLTEKYNRTPTRPITLADWDHVYRHACQVEPNNTVLNLLNKARDERHRKRVVELFRASNVPFRFDEEWCSYLYMNGIIDYEEISAPGAEAALVCRFSSPFIQHRLYSAFSADMAELSERVPVVDPRVDLTGVFAALDLPGLLGAYRDFLRRAKARGQNPWQGQPRRGDLHLREAVGHFHLYWWLTEASGRIFVITPEFATGNGKVDLHIRHQDQVGVIEVKSFTQRWELPFQREQAARYAQQRGLAASTLALFVPTDDEALVESLSGRETIAVGAHRIEVTTVAIAAA